jgi:LPXTG-motif cell wall-anchored protein
VLTHDTDVQLRSTGREGDMSIITILIIVILVLLALYLVRRVV